MSSDAVVDVFVAPLDASAPHDPLSPDERARAARFLRARDRDRFVACRGWLRRLLASYGDRRPADLVFTYGPFGKPALADDPRLRFNVSHTSGLALIAVARGRDVGVDVERADRAVDWEPLARRFFAPGEATAILNFPEAARREAFLACWTRKEAYVKARGDGVRLLRRFEVSVDPRDERPALSEPDASAWSLHTLRPAPGFLAALAVAGGPARVRIAAAGSALGEGAAVPAGDDRGVHPYERHRAR